MNYTARERGARRIVPAYALTGKTRPRVVAALPLESVVTTTHAGLAAVVDLQFEKRSIVLLCRRPTAIAELAARLTVPLGVARVLVSDLTEQGHLAVHVPDNQRPDRDILERLLHGLESR